METATVIILKRITLAASFFRTEEDPWQIYYSENNHELCGYLTNNNMCDVWVICFITITHTTRKKRNGYDVK